MQFDGNIVKHPRVQLFEDISKRTRAPRHRAIQATGMLPAIVATNHVTHAEAASVAAVGSGHAHKRDSFKLSPAHVTHPHLASRCDNRCENRPAAHAKIDPLRVHLSRALLPIRYHHTPC